MATIISRQKVQAVIKKLGYAIDNNFSMYSSGFSIAKFKFGDEFEVIYNFGKNTKAREAMEKLASVGDELVKLGANVTISVMDMDINPKPFLVINSTGFGYNFGHGEFIEIAKPFIEKREKAEQEEAQRKTNEQARHKANEYARRNAARELNPDVKWECKEGNLDSGVGYAELNGADGRKQYVLFSYENSKAFWSADAEDLYSLHIYHCGTDNYGGRNGGSTFVNGFKTVEDGLIEYIATWHV